MKRLSEVLSGDVITPEVLRAARAKRTLRRWEDVVGDVLAKKVFPDRYEAGTLWVVADGSSWGQEVRLKQEEILDRLNKLAGEPGLFRLIKISRTG